LNTVPDDICGYDACAATPRAIVGKEMNMVVKMIIYYTYLSCFDFELMR
jgi:hypothetical protein